jgi:hypothetical protein
VCNITKGFDIQSILTTEIGLSAFAADCYISGLTYQDLDQNVYEHLSLQYLGYDKFDMVVQRVELLTDNGFLKYIESAVKDETIKDYDSFMIFYKKESPAALKMNKPKN